jgi:hypothetical protein
MMFGTIRSVLLCADGRFLYVANYFYTDRGYMNNYKGLMKVLYDHVKMHEMRSTNKSGKDNTR